MRAMLGLWINWSHLDFVLRRKEVPHSSSAGECHTESGEANGVSKQGTREAATETSQLSETSQEHSCPVTGMGHCAGGGGVVVMTRTDVSRKVKAEGPDD